MNHDWRFLLKFGQKRQSPANVDLTRRSKQDAETRMQRALADT